MFKHDTEKLVNYVNEAVNDDEPNETDYYANRTFQNLSQSDKISVVEEFGCVLSNKSKKSTNK
jgi:hypothetical protein